MVQITVQQRGTGFPSNWHQLIYDCTVQRMNDNRSVLYCLPQSYTISSNKIMKDTANHYGFFDFFVVRRITRWLLPGTTYCVQMTDFVMCRVWRWIESLNSSRFHGNTHGISSYWPAALLPSPSLTLLLLLPSSD